MDLEKNMLNRPPMLIRKEARSYSLSQQVRLVWVVRDLAFANTILKDLALDIENLNPALNDMDCFTSGYRAKFRADIYITGEVREMRPVSGLCICSRVMAPGCSNCTVFQLCQTFVHFLAPVEGDRRLLEEPKPNHVARSRRSSCTLGASEC
jgi:hypothetical protein